VTYFCIDLEEPTNTAQYQVAQIKLANYFVGKEITSTFALPKRKNLFFERGNKG
jgi:hypothetical protein